VWIWRVQWGRSDGGMFCSCAGVGRWPWCGSPIYRPDRVHYTLLC
jgi:hypothetical protein